MTSSAAASSDTPRTAPARRYDPRTVTHWGDTMRRRTLLIITAAVVIAIAVTTAVLWMNGKSYDDTVKACQKALAAQYKAGGKGKPDDCKGVKADDYDALVMQAAMDSLGWTDEDGNFDKNKMLDSVAEQP